MDDSDRLHLQKMISSNNVEDYTNDIKAKKHSQLIRNDVSKLLELKKKYPRFQTTCDFYAILECKILL